MPLLLAGLFLAGGLALPGSVQGQITPQSINQPCTACEATSVHAADLDGDGSTDVLSTSRFDDKVAWYENNGGSYGEQQVISTATDKPQTVTAADLDGDGDLDVISGSKGDNKLVWYENQMGEGGADSDGFGPAQVISTSYGSVVSVAAGKIDSDDKADVVIGTSDGVYWFSSQIGDSGDDFSAASTVSNTAFDPITVDVADLSGDDTPDVVYAHSGSFGQVVWHENTGSGFGSATLISDNLSQPSSVTAANVDDDTALEVITTSSGKVAWYDNTGGSFGAQTVIASYSGTTIPEAVAAGDRDDDGDAEVFAGIGGSSGEGDRVVWYESQVGEAGADADGFGSEQVMTSSLNSIQKVEAANLDSDAASEVLSASMLDEKIAWYDNTGSGYGSAQPVNLWPDAAFPKSVETVMIDDDMDSDVLVASRDDGKVSWYANTDGQGTFSDQYVITSNERRTYQAIAVNLNGDNKSDVVAVFDGTLDGSKTGMVAWYENQTGESGSDADGFTDGKIIAEGETMDHVASADLNGDDKKDILVVYGGSFGSQKVVWYENQIGEAGSDADGFSTENVIASGLSSVESLHAADLNGGGNDVLFGYGSPYSDPQKLVWHENTDGNGSFSSEKVIESYSGYSALSLTTAKVDSDDDLDVAAGLFSSGTANDVVAWYENEIGQGGDADGFGARTTVASGVERPRDIHLADVTGNSKPDLLAAYRDSDTVTWHANTGGSFTSQTVISSVAYGVTSVTTADINQDSDLDVLSVSEASEEVAWYENTDGVLPVEMAGIDAQVDGDAVRLTWSTASETNNAGFHIQRKEQGTQKREGAWATVGKVEGSGTTSRVQRYQFTDENLPYEADAITYRLKQVDTDGSAHYTKTITVERGVDTVQLLGTYPNPVGQQATLRYALPERQDVEVRLYDVLGRQVRTVVRGTKEGRQEQTLDVSGLPSGVYFLRLQSGGQVRTQKLTVVQ